MPSSPRCWRSSIRSTPRPPSTSTESDRHGSVGCSLSWFDKIKASVTRSRDALLGLETMALARRPLDAAFWEEFEEILIGADFGFATTEKIVGALTGVAKQDRYQTSDQVIARFKRDVKTFLTLPDMGLQLERKPAV